ncbi:hypothetical protein Q7P37_005114 [Cladosporium fusiforme]
MDTGTYNCRDYHISPHFAAATLTSTTTSNHAHLQRHESWAELEQRSRSPASQKPKFPLLHLPLELRQQILLYLLPRTQELGSHADPLETHVRNFSAVQKRVRKGMELPPAKEEETPVPGTSKPRSSSVPTNVAWRRGHTGLFAVCRQLHDECADLVYGGNTFMLGVTFSNITFRFRYLLASGMAPQREYAFLDLMPKKYLRRLRRLLVSVDHVDSYTGMIKYNVSGKGLVHGLRRQVAKLVSSLQSSEEEKEREQGEGGEVQRRDQKPSPSLAPEERAGFARVTIRISNGNTVTQSLKAQFGEVQRISEDIEEILEPFGRFCGVREARVMGAVGQTFARGLEEKMRSCEAQEQEQGRKSCRCMEGMADLVVVEEKAVVPLCVYGNDI